MMSGRQRYQREYFAHPVGDIAVRVGFDADRGRITDFTVQLECWIEGRWRPAVRYDTAHGQAHRDTLDWDGTVVAKDWLPAAMDYGDAMNDAILELTRQARTYREAFVGRRRG